MRAVEELFEGNEVVIRLTHLLSGNGDHIVMHPIVHRLMSLCCHALGNFTLMVREHQIESAAMNIEFLAEIFLSHSGAFEMPPREALAPWGRPMHDMLRRSLLPESEIERIALLLLTVEGAGIVLHLLNISSRKLPIVMVAVIFLHVEINRSAAFISISGLKNLLHIFNLLDDMTRSMGLDARGKHIKGFHILMVAVEVELHHFHRFELFETRFLGNLILAGIRIMFEMPHVGDISDIAHLESEMKQIAIEDIEGDGRTCMTQMSVSIDSRATHIHTDMPVVNRPEGLFHAGKRIVNKEIILHQRYSLY